MITPKYLKVADGVNAVVLWLALAFSLGWYYTITYYGREGWPMPSIETCGGLILYYFSVLNIPTEGQAIHWMLVFPMAGILWVALLTLTAPFFGAQNRAFTWSMFHFALATLPLSLPGPYLAYIAGQTENGWSVHAMIQVALRRGGVMPWASLSPMYLLLALIALAWHLYVYRQIFELTGRIAWTHFLVTAVLFILTIAGLGAAAALPLRYYLEGGMSWG